MNDIKELIYITKSLCDGYRDMPCGCEGCPLFDLEECEKDGEHYKCAYVKILDNIIVQ